MNPVTVFVSFSDKQLIFFVVFGTDALTSRQILSFVANSIINSLPLGLMTRVFVGEGME